ncbi:YgaP family membrane protein [Pontibacter kalidii]|uniref:YgaP family membrane protein n=1 Tax=Pontibacter kalidii TaxID=2592049 RepID=UPI002254172B|nr:DUF2892 domain-containing protein [Pontibacter kalidii]
MECNVGIVEQKARVLAGLALIGIGAYYNSKPLAAVGIIPILTGMLRWCPINAAVGYDGCRNERTWYGK